MDNPVQTNAHLMNAHAVFEEDGLSLSGKWRFYSLSPDTPLPEDWISANFDEKKWERISVPGVWKSASGINNGASLTGLYRKSFILSKDQGSRQIILRFDALSPDTMLWINGTYIGKAPNTGLPVEFDITEAVHTEKNIICLQMPHAAQASGFAGISGGVTLYSLPARAITRLESRTEWTPEGSPVLHISLNARESDGFIARIALMDGNRIIRYVESTVIRSFAEARIPCSDVELWCSEHPKLYRVAVILWDGIAMYHTRELTVGFRRIEQQDNSILINGQPEKLFAVSYDPIDSGTGCFTAPEQMEQDLATLRTHHFNAIMLNSTAPDVLYALCDRLGLYVMDRSGSDVSPEATREQAEERNRRMEQIFGTHPSIILWSAAGHPGILSVECCSILRDPSSDQISHLLCSEAEPASPSDQKKRKAAKAQNTAEANGAKAVLLLFSRVPEELDRLVPLIRNAGNVFSVVFGSHSQLFSQGTATPLLRELRVLLQPMAFSYEDGTVTVTNLSHFRSTSAYQCRYLLTRDGETIINRELELEVGPGETKSLFVETQYDIFKAGRYHLTVGYVNPESGASVASAQWEVAHLRHIFDENPGGTIREEQGFFHLRSGDSAFTVNRSNGALEQITLGDRPMLTDAACHVYASESEKTPGLLLADEWEKLTFGRKKPKPSVLEVDHMTRTVSASYKLGSGLIQNWRLYSDGSLACELRLRTGRTAPALIGVSLPLAQDIRYFRWFGLGPDDAAEHHQAGRFFGKHTQEGAASVSHGAKDPVYQLTVTDGSGFGLAVRSEDGLRASFRPGEKCNLLRLERSGGALNPHTTYTFSFIIQPISK